MDTEGTIESVSINRVSVLNGLFIKVKKKHLLLEQNTKEINHKHS